MRLIADTHAALWLATDDERLSTHAGDLLEDPANEVLLSAVVVWEIEIKRAIGKLDAPDYFIDRLLSLGVVELPVTIAHARAMRELPLHHHDPFDRLLIAQARAEGAILVSADERIRRYAVPVEW